MQPVMNTEISFLVLAGSGALYLASEFFYLSAFLQGNEKANRAAFFLMRVGFLIHTFFFFSETRPEGLVLPISNFGHVMAFFSWALAFVYLVLIKTQSESFGLIFSPLLVVLVGIGLAGFDSPPAPLPEPLNPFFVVHLGTAFFAYASFTLSFVASLLYLVQNHALKQRKGGTFYKRLPSLESLEGLIFPPMAWGVFLLALAIGVGLLWSKSAFGTFWLKEPKTMVTIVVGLAYLVLVSSHYAAHARGKRMVVFSLLAFGLIVAGFFGTNLISGGHPKIIP